MKKHLLCLCVLSLFSCKDLITTPTHSEPQNLAPTSQAPTEPNTHYYQSTSIHVKEHSEEDTLEITTQGLEQNNSPITQPLQGYKLVKSELVVLNKQTDPILLLQLQSPGSGSYGTIIAYNLNSKQQLTPIEFTSSLTDQQLNQGYMGHDTYTIKEGQLIRTFPVYDERDTNAHPSLGQREITYHLVNNPQGQHFEILQTRDIDQ